MGRRIAVLAVIVAAAALPAAPTAAPRAVVLNAADRAVLDQLNVVRARHGLHRLVVSPGLTAAARQHSLEMVRRGYFAHESADGSSFDRRVRRFYPRFRVAGENLAYGVPDLTAAEAMDLWLKSPPHRRNLLDPSWREIGISVVHVEAAPGPDFRGQPTTVMTTDFGRR